MTNNLTLYLAAWPGQLTSDDNGEAELLQDGFKQNRSSDLIDRENITISTAQEKHSNQWAEAVEETEKDRALHNLDDCVIKCKSVFKCKLCPRIVCLSVDTMEAHLVSKVYTIFMSFYNVRYLGANQGAQRIIFSSDLFVAF
jgi:hypothetical protein